MFIYFLLASCIPLVSGNFWNLPSNVKFTLGFYNNSRCMNNYSNQTELILYCQNSQIVNGHPDCCYEQLVKLSPFNDPIFDFCYDASFNNTENYVSYNCTEASFTDISTVEIFGFIGLILLIIFSFCLFYFIFKKMFCVKNDYERFS